MKNLIRILSVTLIMIMTISIFTFAEGYDFEIIDASEINAPSNWAKPEIDKAKEAGLLTENTDNYFKEDITRFQFAELVVNMVEKAIGKGITPASSGTFTDTKEGSILKAYSAGIVAGVSETEFAPSNYITREQIATMVYRAIVYIESEKGEEFTTKNSSIESYTDKNDVSSWAKEGVGVLANNNIMSGTSSTTLSPKNSATIEQSILLVYRLYNVVNQE